MSIRWGTAIRKTSILNMSFLAFATVALAVLATTTITPAPSTRNALALAHVSLLG